jgi:mRNA interferase MazF
MENERMNIQQGELYWIQIQNLDGSDPEYSHPYVILQENVFNRSRLQTVIVCALTSNIQRANAPGNVLLEPGEANLPRQSVVEVSKISSVDKLQLGEYIGVLSGQRIQAILAGMQFLQLTTERREIDQEQRKGEV